MHKEDGSVYSIMCLFTPILQNVAWLTIERLTDGLQGGETDGLCLARFQDGEIGLGNANLLRQFL